MALPPFVAKMVDSTSRSKVQILIVGDSLIDKGVIDSLAALAVDLPAFDYWFQ